MIDNLKFVYDTASQNRLLKVNDLSNSPQGFKDNYTSTANDFTYDNNGNMTADVNKEIESITYNHLNLPIKINFGAKGNIYYLYNAIGGKVKKVVEDNVAHITTTTDYLSGFQYLNTELQFFPHAEGYVHYTKPLAAQGGENSALGSFNYVFNYTDHLGNVRLSYARDPLVRNRVKILEENHYYAFGLKHKNYNVEKLNFEEFPDTGVEIVPAPAVANASYNYKYNGKELQEELGLNFYDYGARNYDPSLGRWMNVDPLASKNNFESPYVYVHNNPLIYVDPDGRDGIIVIKDGQININANVYAYGAGATKQVISQMQSDVNSRWGGNFSAQTSDGKQKFNVKINVNISLYEGKEKNDPSIIEESWNPNNRDNFVEIGSADKRSYVTGGDEGEWRSQGRNGLTLAQDDPAPHEVGHLLGLDDRYTDKNGPNKGWETNIMGSSQKGKVEQRNIDGILGDAMKAYQVWSQDKNNAGKEFKYEINTNNPNKENK